MTVAKMAIVFANSRDELAEWWRDEKLQRINHFLSEEQTDELAKACQRHINSLNTTARQKPKQQWKGNRRSLI